MMRKKMKLLLILLILFNVFCRTVYASEYKPEVHILDVGQSDCILIKNGEENYLIDSGDNDKSGKIINYLKNQGINTIDFIILTHYHGDHYGGLYDITKSLKTKIVYVPEFYVVKEERDRAIQSLLKTKTPFRVIGKGWSYKKNSLDLKVLLPTKAHESLENNNSIVIKGEINKKNYLFMADCEFDEENELLQMKNLGHIDVLKLAHHGFDNASSKEFLEKINAKYTIITCNGKESPENGVIDRLEESDTNVIRTDKFGDIIITEEGEKGIKISI